MRQIADKWNKFRVLSRHDGVAKHIPAMQKYSVEHLREMLNQYGYVVAKPIVGTGGHGVVKIERSGASGYSLHHGARRRGPLSWDAMTAEVERIRHGRPYMIQQGIRLATIGGRPVDYRVKMVKQGSGWHVTAVVARVARPGLFVTNMCRGGQVLHGTVALRRTFPAKVVRPKRATMVGVARTCTYLLEREYPGLGALGYDFGVDRRGRVWILEANTRPH